MQKTVYAFEYPFSVDEGLGRLAAQTDLAEHVEQMIKQVLFTDPGERINRPEFGCGIRRMVFALNSPEMASLAQVTIQQALDKWLINVLTVNKIEVSSENETMNINISYFLKVDKEQRYLNVEVGL